MPASTQRGRLLFDSGGHRRSTVRGERSDSSRRPQEAPSLEKRVCREALLAREDDVIDDVLPVQ